MRAGRKPSQVFRRRCGFLFGRSIVSASRIARSKAFASDGGAGSRPSGGGRGAAMLSCATASFALKRAGSTRDAANLRNIPHANTTMPFRYRRSIRLAPGVRINLSKTGGSLSAGAGGFTANLNRRGVQSTISARGTRLSYRTRRRSGSSVIGTLIFLGILAVVLACVL